MGHATAEIRRLQCGDRPSGGRPANQNLPDDQSLVDAVLAGDPEAARHFAARFAPFVWSILTRGTRIAPQLAEDIFQDVFLRLIEDDFRPLRAWRREGSFASYLGPIVRHLAIDRLRRLTPPGDRLPFDSPDGDGPPPIDPPDPDPDPEALARIEERRRVLELALEHLLPRDRELIRLRYFEDLSYREVGEQLAMTVNHVGVALARAEERLRQVVQEHFPGALEEEVPWR